MPEKLAHEVVNERLQELPEWKLEGGTIIRDVICRDFRHALGFVNKVGDLAEEMDHHPDLLIHGWNRVRIMLSTHSVGGLTENDFKLAHAVEQLIVQE